MKASIVNRFLVLATIALPVVPVLSDYFGPSTYARWLLADAANQYDRGNVTEAQESLQKAYDLSKDIVTDGNFWRQFERIEGDTSGPSKSSKIWEDMVGRVADPEQRAVAALEVSSLLSNRRQFDVAAKILVDNLPPREDRNAIQNNQIAYMRSLAKLDLDEALLDINQAIKQLNNESFLDTKAWVLHQLGRNEEALPIIDESLSMLIGKWRANPKIEPFIAAMIKIEEGLSTSDSTAPAEANEAIKPKEIPAATEASQSPEKDPDPDAAESTATAQENAGSPSGEQSSGNKARTTAKRSAGWAMVQLLEEFPVIARGVPTVMDLPTLRYHRMKIHEALGNTEAMQKDLRWLEAFSIKGTDDLH
ncbi:MAG: hypothetical protein ACK52S_01625 [Pirellula sp.]